MDFQRFGRLPDWKPARYGRKIPILAARKLLPFAFMAVLQWFCCYPFILAWSPCRTGKVFPVTIFDPQPISEYAPKLRPVADPSHGGGGGGDHEQTPATKGMLPTFSMKAPIVPPGLVRNPNAELQVTPTLLGSPQLNVPAPALENWGLPNAPALTDSQGAGSDSGIGNGGHGGIGNGGGPGEGPGSRGGTGGNVFTPGSRTGIGFPVCIACPRPDYSEEARKAKVQGSVLLSVIVLPDGKVGGIELVKSLGMGLDQQAIDSVKTWKFRPGTTRKEEPWLRRFQSKFYSSFSEFA